jgi:hypothetical protein
MTDTELAVASALRSLDGPAFSAFVADLWRARGRTVEREGDTLVVEGESGRTALAPMAASRVPGRLRSVPEGAEAVVTPARSAPFADGDMAVVTGAELASMLRYGVPPETAATLCETHLGASPEELGLPVGVRARRALSGVALRRVGAALALVVAAAALALTLPVGGGVDGAGAASADTGTGAGGVAGSASSSVGTGTFLRTTTPRPDGEFSAASLAGEHREALEGKNYTLTTTVVYSGTYLRRPWILTRSFTVIGERFVIDDRGVGAVESIPNRDVYYDGSNTYTAAYRNDSFAYDRRSGRPFDPEARSVEHLRTYLDVEEFDVAGTRQEGGERQLILRGEGVPPTVEGSNYTVEVYVDREGFIHRTDVNYDRLNGVESRMIWHYEELENATLSVPRWYEEEFANETARGTSPSVNATLEGRSDANGSELDGVDSFVTPVDASLAPGESGAEDEEECENVSERMSGVPTPPCQRTPSGL